MSLGSERYDIYGWSQLRRVLALAWDRLELLMIILLILIFTDPWVPLNYQILVPHGRLGVLVGSHRALV